MNTFHSIKGLGSILTALLLAISSIGSVGAASGTHSPAAQENCFSSGLPSVSTDKDDYGPFEVVTISGSGFGCGEALSVLVTAPDGSTLSGDGNGSAGPDSVTTDENGAFVLSYQLSGTLPDGGMYQGQPGTYTVEIMNTSGVLLASAAFTDGSVAAYHTCAVTTGGGVKCWGDNRFGQLGDGTTTNRNMPEDVSGLTSGVVQVTTGTYHTCALTTGGGVKCWGRNYNGQLGDGTFTNRATPVDVSGLASGVAQISGGGYHTCALTTGGGIKCWGWNYHGQLGDGTFGPNSYGKNTPVDVVGLSSGVAQISAGYAHTCALTTNGGVKCWGYNESGQLGNGIFTTSSPYGISTPVDVSGLTSGVAQISAGGYHTCALTTNGGVKCWGYNQHGQLGNDTFTTSPPYGFSTPENVNGLASGVAQVSVGYLHTCGLTMGSVKCWGRNLYGQLGDGTYTDRATPVDVSGLASDVAQISVGGYHTCALTTGGGIKCWGRNYEGQLGDGTYTDRATPVDVSGLAGGVALLPEIVGISNQPPIADAGGPYTINEGDEVMLDASGSSDPDNNITIYEWDLDNDSAYDDATGISTVRNFADNGAYFVGLKVTDEGDEPDTDTAEITVANVLPIVNAGSDASLTEGDAFMKSGSFTDPGADVWTATVNYGDIAGVESLTLNPDKTFALNHTYLDDGDYAVEVCVSDDDSGIGCDALIVSVANIAPTIKTLLAPINPMQVGATVETSAAFTDPGVLDTHSATWDWGDGSESGGVINSYSVSGSHIYESPGVYTLRLIGEDDDAGSDTAAFQFVVIFDPEGGFVTGGGWINSPEGAYSADPALTGKATFGFVSKYQKGANVPSGNTEFQFKVADLNFKSTSYDWLVVSGSKAKYKGVGVINGTGEYGFMLSAIDGTPDKFRIKIWEKATGVVVYDNQLGAADDADPVTAIGGGSIVVHKEK